MGNVVAVDGQVQIIEYSDLPDDVAALRQPDGSLKLWAGNIAVHVFDVAFLKRMSSGDGRLPVHFANKKVPYIDMSGKTVEPEKPNAIKFEQFIFDLLPAAKKSLVMEVDEAADFAPVKNGDGAERDTPITVRRRIDRAASPLARGGRRQSGRRCQRGNQSPIRHRCRRNGREGEAGLASNCRQVFQ